VPRVALRLVRGESTEIDLAGRQLIVLDLHV